MSKRGNVGFAGDHASPRETPLTPLLHKKERTSSTLDSTESAYELDSNTGGGSDEELEEEDDDEEETGDELDETMDDGAFETSATGRRRRKRGGISGFDLLAEEEDIRDPNEKIRQITVDLSIPPPSSTATKVKAKVAEASYLSEKIVQNKSVYDSEVYYLCLKYHQTHQKEHSALKKAHGKREEQMLSSLPFATLVGVILDDPSKTFIGRVFAAFEFLLVFVTIVQLGMETLPSTNPNIRPEWTMFWFRLELGITLFFTAETIVRILVTTPKRLFLKSVYNWLDIAAVLPFYISLIGLSGFDFIKVLRTARFVKLMRNFRHIDALIVTLRKISRSLIAPALFLGLSVLVISTALYFSEEGKFHRSGNYLDGITFPKIPNNTQLILPQQEERFSLIKNISTLLQLSTNATEWSRLSDVEQKFVQEVKRNSTANTFLMEDCFCTSTPSFFFGDRTCPQVRSRFPTITEAMYFTIMSMTLVGFGGVVPRCAPGKLLAAAGLFASTVFLAMPIAIVGVSFMESVDEAKGREVDRKKENRRNIRKLRVEAEMGNRKIREKGMVKGMSDALKSGVGMLRKSFRHSNESLAEQRSRRKQERQKKEQKEKELRILESEQQSATSAESLLLHLAQSLRCRYFNFATREGIVDELYSAQTPTAQMTSNGRQISFGDLNTSVVHHIDAFLILLFESWVQQWFSEHRQKILGLDTIDENAQAASSSIKGLSAAKRKTQAASKLFTSHKNRTVDRSVSNFLEEQHKVVQLFQQASGQSWFNRLSLMEVVTGTAEGDVFRKQGEMRGVTKHLTFSRLTEYRIVASNNLNVQPGSKKTGGPVGVDQQQGGEMRMGLGPGGSMHRHNQSNHMGMAEDDDDDVILTINAPDFILPHTIAKIQVLTGFLSRMVRLVVCSPWSYQVLVNGEKVQPHFHASRLPFEAPTVEEWDIDSDKATIRWDPTIDGQEMDDIFVKYLKDGDIINLTPIIRVPKSSYIGTFRPESGNSNPKARRKSKMQSTDQEETSAGRAARHFESMGLVPVVYKLCLGPETSADNSGSNSNARSRSGGGFDPVEEAVAVPGMVVAGGRQPTPTSALQRRTVGL